MAKSHGFKTNRKARNALVKQIVDDVCVPAMQQVADKCNTDAGIDDGFRVSVEGDDPLDKRDYRATVITATPQAIRHDRRHDTLLRNFGVEL